MAKVTYCCSSCGSVEVLRDAWAYWNVETQLWELSQTFQQGFCETCDGEASLDEIALAEGPGWLLTGPDDLALTFATLADAEAHAERLGVADLQEAKPGLWLPVDGEALAISIEAPDVAA